jgi:hypothetical protein
VRQLEEALSGLRDEVGALKRDRLVVEMRMQDVEAERDAYKQALRQRQAEDNNPAVPPSTGASISGRRPSDPPSRHQSGPAPTAAPAAAPRSAPLRAFLPVDDSRGSPGVAAPKAEPPSPLSWVPDGDPSSAKKYMVHNSDGVRSAFQYDSPDGPYPQPPFPRVQIPRLRVAGPGHSPSPPPYYTQPQPAGPSERERRPVSLASSLEVHTGITRQSGMK